MTKPLEDIDARAAASLTHPLRMAILWALEDGPASPSELARRIEAPLEAVSYHVRKLHEVGIIQADEPEVLEGNVRHPYRLAEMPRVSNEAWGELPPEARDVLAHASLARAWRAATAALSSGGFRREEVFLCRVALMLDDEGFEEANAILYRAEAELLALNARVAERSSEEDREPVGATAFLTLFENSSEDTVAPMLVDLYEFRDNRQAGREGDSV